MRYKHLNRIITKFLPLLLVIVLISSCKLASDRSEQLKEEQNQNYSKCLSIRERNNCREPDTSKIEYNNAPFPISAVFGASFVMGAISVAGILTFLFGSGGYDQKGGLVALICMLFGIVFFVIG
jgi:hypothetical protein